MINGEVRTTLRKLQHDLRTPIGQILGYSEMLEEELSGRDLTELGPDLQHIRSAATTLLSLVDGIFRSEDGAHSMSPEASRDVVNEPAVPSGVSGHLLLVDDESANRELLGRQLRRAGFDVSEAESGRAALSMIARHEFDLVLLDVLMPDLNGVQILKSIRSTMSVSELPVIMATALAETRDVVAALEAGANDYVTKPFDMALVAARIQTQLDLRGAAEQIKALAQQLEIRNLFLRRTFGRFLSDDVVTSLLESDDGLEIRGERRRVSILVADLRGFTSLTQALEPDEIVAILNTYLATMADVVQEYQGTVDEFLGDAIIAHFGAIATREDDAERAVACAIAMQLAIEEVNRINRGRQLPAVEMGVGVATGSVIVGNLGSEKRSKHTAIGSAVNLASRIEGYTMGGEILLSQTTFEDVEDLVQVDRVREVWPKGFEAPQNVYRVVGIRGTHEMDLPLDRAHFVDLVETIPVRFALLEGKSISRYLHDGHIVALSTTGARIVADADVSELAELRIEVVGSEGEDGVCYAKVVDLGADLETVFTVRFSSRSTVLERVGAEHVIQVR